MHFRFDILAETILNEMAATFKDTGNVKQSISDIKTKNLPHHYQKPLVAIADDSDRNEMIDKIISTVFGAEKFSPDINNKKELQDALEKAVVEVSKSSGSKFARPVQGVAANYLGRWLGTNINVEYSRSGEKELENKGASVIAAKEILTKTLTPTESEKEELKANSKESDSSSQGSVKDYSKILSGSHRLIERAFDTLKSKLEPINKKLGKLGLGSIQLNTTKETFSPVKGGTMLNKFIEFTIVLPQMELPGGWKFVARVDHEDAGNIIVSNPNSGHERDLHSMYGNSQPSFCDHCKTTRRRTSTFVVEDEKGELKRIGRQCLKAYLPGGENAVKRIVEYAQYLSDVAEGVIEVESGGGEGGDGDDRDGFGGGGSGSRYFEARMVLGLGQYLVDLFGYVSKTRANESGSPSTSDRLTTLIFNQFDREVQAVWKAYDEKREEYESQTNDIIEWGINYVEEQLKQKGPSDYMNNLRVILKGAKENNSVASKYLGYLLSIIPFYKRAKEQAAGPKEAAKESNYVGVEGMPIGDLNANDKRKLKKSGIDASVFPYNGPIKVTVKSARGFERQGFGYYDQGGAGTVLTMVDDNGNVYVTFLSHASDVKPGDRHSINRALVKSHKEYTDKSGKTTKQTTITRADISLKEEADKS